MSERTSQTGELSAADAAEATPVQRLLDSLGRLAATAAIYGDGHPRVMTIAAETASWLQSAGARGAAIDVDSALAQDADHSAGAFAGRISRDLDRLGALRAVFLPQVDAAALVEFARFLRRGVAPQGGGAFRTADFSALPASIVITPRTYRAGGAAPADEAAGAVSVFASAEGDEAHPVLAEHAAAYPSEAGVPLDDETRAVVERLLEVAGRMGARTKADVVRAPGSLREVVRAAAEALGRKVRREREGEGRTIDDLMHGIHDLLTRVLPAYDVTPLHSMLTSAIDEHLRDTFTVEPSAKAGIETEVRREESHDPPESDVFAEIQAFTEGAEEFHPVEDEDVVEELAILLQLHGGGSGAPGAEHVERRVHATAARGLDDDALAVLGGWMRELCFRAPPAQFDEIVGPVLAGLKRVAPLAFASAILECARAGHTAVIQVTWPQIAVALLAANRQSDASFRENAIEALARVPASRMRYEAGRVASALPAYDRNDPPLAIATPRPELYPLYDVLLGLPAERGYAAALVAAFERRAEVHPFAAAFAGLPQEDERGTRLLGVVVREGEESAAARSLAAEILIGRLRAVPHRERGSSWVASSVQALGALPCRAAAEFLHAVVVERRFVLFGWAWPELIRLGALEASVAADYRSGRRVPVGDVA